ncbi:hypothetical protein WN944_001648 [Citrus x changshan-huyou]|uniref:Uncharacterized protein n=1 Tax=Citrus x changshan-huyou TaxID=2935761 RepID=A0AAP0MHI8_9ROSI
MAFLKVDQIYHPIMNFHIAVNLESRTCQVLFTSSFIDVFLTWDGFLSNFTFHIEANEASIMFGLARCRNKIKVVVGSLTIQKSVLQLAGHHNSCNIDFHLTPPTMISTVLVVTYFIGAIARRSHSMNPICARPQEASQSEITSHKPFPQYMATVTPTMPPPFTFVLEYMGSTMMIKSIRPMHYTLIRLCNITALVLQTRESHAVHYFYPKVVLAWDGRMVDVNTDDAFKKIIRLSMINGCCSLHVLVRFSVNAAHSPTLGPPSKLCSTREDVPVVRDAVGHSDQYPAATTAVARYHSCTIGFP